jgi:transcriptional regulator with XRE-family HTH domain
MTDFLERWANQSEDNARLLAQELLITEITEKIWNAMELAGVNKTELANRMGATKGYVSQVLSGSRNMTLRTLSDICFALDKKATISVDARTGVGEWQIMRGARISLTPAKLHYKRTSNIISSNDHWLTAA